MKRLNVIFAGQRIGQLLAADGIHYFEYDVRYLRQALPLSPFKLPPLPGASAHRHAHFYNLPGLIYDSLPDRFGMSVLRDTFAAKGIPHPTPLEMLSALGGRTMGALTYEPAEGATDEQSSIDICAAVRSARTLQLESHGAELDPAIVQAGGTAGGATPKLLAALSPDRKEILTGADQIPAGMEAWLVKLNTTEKGGETEPRSEMAYFEMARQAGIVTPETMLLKDRNGRSHFAIRRFDRAIEDPNQRIHLHSYAAMAEIDFSDSTHDYEDLLRLTKKLCRDHQALCQQFRRMLFNVLACNHDDHAKNFSFIMDASGQWKPSPAYDLVYASNQLGGNWMMVRGKRSQLSYDDFLSLAELMGLTKSEFDDILSEVKTAVLAWAEIAGNNGLGKTFAQVVHASIEQACAAL